MLEVFHFTGFGASVKEAEHVLAELKDLAFLTVIIPSHWNEKVDLRCSCSGVFILQDFRPQ